MRGITSWQWFLALLSGILQVVIFPSPNIFALCWIALVPLVIAILRPPGAPVLIAANGQLLGTTPWQGFLLGYACGLVWYAGTCFWVYHAMHWYGGLSAGAAIGVLILFCLYLALYHGFFGLLLAAARRRSLHGLRRALLLAPFLWVAVELGRSRVTSFPWDLLGGAQVDNIPLTRVAVLTGVYGVSFIIVLANCGIAATLMAPARAQKRLLPLALAIAVMLQLGIFAQPRALAAPHSALLVQQNVPMDVNWDRASLRATLQQLSALSSLPVSASAEPRLVIWPESPAPFFSNDADFAASVSALAQRENAYVIVAEVGVLPPKRDKAGKSQELLTNRAQLIAPTGAWLGHYDKIHLVPFGEYVPYPSLFSFASGLTEQVGNYVPGATRAPLNIAGNKYGAFICYESVFPNQVRQFAANGAEVFINLSDDGWYGAYGAPGQHLNMARMRAIENRRWLLRATNTGVTASIDPFGRVVARAPANQRVTLNAPYDFIAATTFYTRHGDWFAWACVIISILGLTLKARLRAGKIGD